jgi:magnesium chelatase family protein
VSLAVTYTRAQIGIKAPLVNVEVHLGGGLPGIAIVGLAETAVKESKDRVKGALVNSKFTYPSDHKIIVNLAPADLPKEGGRYDLAIALCILAASGQIPTEVLADHEFVGELALTGELRPVRGVLPSAMAAEQSNHSLIIPSQNSEEASLLRSGTVRAAGSLLDVCNHLCKKNRLARIDAHAQAQAHNDNAAKLSDIRGQYLAKRALQIAAAGGHNLLFTGPPGSGKTMLASRLASLLPPLPGHQALEVASIQSVSDHNFSYSNWSRRPYRAPHHTASAVALVGGGSTPRPGEISLAHLGVLFLDELPEFDRKVLEVLREPLESGEIMISRAKQNVRFPAQFQLVAAMNPCPCGYYGDEKDRCICSQDKIARYRSRISGPLLDRIDLHVDVPALPRGLLSDPTNAAQDDSEHVNAVQQIAAARTRMMDRFGKLNRDLNADELGLCCILSTKNRNMLDTAIERLGISARGYFRILKVARTIADISDCSKVETPHLTEALGYRNLERYQI